MNKLSYISMFDLFRDLNPDEKAELDRTVTMTTCDAGRIFYMPDDTGEVLFLLKRGRVQLYRMTPEGKKIVVTTLEAGAVFGEMSMIGSGMHATFAEAQEECLLCVMSRYDLERLILQKPQVGLRLIEAMGTRLRQAQARLEEMAFKSIPARLAGLLLRLANEQSDSIITGYTHQDLGEMLGTYRETTTQTLNNFQSRGMIEIGRKRITLKDRIELSREAER